MLEVDSGSDDMHKHVSALKAQIGKSRQIFSSTGTTSWWYGS